MESLVHLLKIFASMDRAVAQTLVTLVAIIVVGIALIVIGIALTRGAV